MTHVSKAMCAMLALTLFLAAPGSARAQSQATTAEINGRIVDSQGGVLPGVTVTATSPQTGYMRDTVTNVEGLFSLPLLPPGTYDVTAELSGFATFRQQGVACDGWRNDYAQPLTDSGWRAGSHHRRSRDSTR